MPQGTPTLQPSYMESWPEMEPQSKYDLFQAKTDLFPTRAFIWVHFKTVHYFYQPIFSLFSYLKNARHNSMTKLCYAFFFYMKIIWKLVEKSTAQFWSALKWERV